MFEVLKSVCVFDHQFMWSMWPRFICVRVICFVFCVFPVRCSFVVSASAIDCLEGLASEMTGYVSSVTVTFYTLTHSLCVDKSISLTTSVHAASALPSRTRQVAVYLGETHCSTVSGIEICNFAMRNLKFHRNLLFSWAYSTQTVRPPPKLTHKRHILGISIRPRNDSH